MDTYNLTGTQCEYTYLFQYRLYLQKIKIPSNLLLLIGIIVTTTGYLLLTDWQTIPFDPCTEYSPFHHPEIISATSLKSINNSKKDTSPKLRFSEVHFQSRVELSFDDGSTLSTSLGFTTEMICTLKHHPEQSNVICLGPSGKFQIPFDVSAVQYAHKLDNDLLCLNISVASGWKFADMSQRVHTQELQVLSDSAYALASNSCINADVPGRQCHWIPFSTITNTKCNDCPPICRAKEQTLNFVQLVVGMALVFLVFPLIRVSLMSIITNHAPNLNGSQVCTCVFFDVAYIHSGNIRANLPKQIEGIT